jgi:hypothetical protein
MQRIIVTEDAVRDLVREALNNKQFGVAIFQETFEVGSPVKVNDVVDPSASVTDPGNEDFRPDTPAEFQVAVKSLIDDLPSDKISDTYEKLVKALHDEEKGEKMKKDTKAEAIVRANVRKIIKESFLNEMPEIPGEPPMPVVPPAPQRKHREHQRVGAPGGELSDIAKALGFSIPGAKLAVDKAIAKAKWVGSMQLGAPEDIEVVVLTAMNDYIKMLAKTGELTPEDVQLLKNNPNIVRELHGFREFLDKHLKRAMRTRPQGFPLDKGDIPWTVRGE